MQVGGGEPGSVHNHANTNQPTPTHGLEAWPLRLEMVEWTRRAKVLVKRTTKPHKDGPKCPSRRKWGEKSA